MGKRRIIPLLESDDESDKDDEHNRASKKGKVKVTKLAVSSATASSYELREDGFPKWFDDIDMSKKPMKYVKRMMGETKKLFSADGMKTQNTEGVIVTLRGASKGHDLSKWDVLLRTEGISKDSQLSKDLQRHKLKGVLLEMTIPDTFPMNPPFIRVRHPKLSGGYVFTHGAICFEPLTPKGWPIAMTLMSLSMAIKGIFDYNPVHVEHVGNVEHQTVPGYTEEGARKDYGVVVAAHNGGQTWSDLSRMKS